MSFISLASMLGIALGVMVLITVLSVMNGFDDQIRSRFFAVAPQITVLAPANDIQHSAWTKLQSKIMKQSRVVASAPFVSGNVMLIKNGQIHPLRLMGVLPKEQTKISKIASKITQGRFSNLAEKQFTIILGQDLADQLNLHMGDKINLFTPQTSVTLAGVFPVFRQFTISGFFHTSGGFSIDNSIAYIHMHDAEKLFGVNQSANGLHLTIDDVYQANRISDALIQWLPPTYMVTNWTQSFGPFSQALDMEKMILFIILLLIVAVAAFNLVSSLVMVVTDKQADIAILRTLGATPGMIMRAFIWQGMIVGAIGTLLGVVGGVVLSLNITAIANWLQHVLHMQLISSTVYLLDFLPSKLVSSDVINIALIAFAMSVIATIYPALLAFRTQPAEALRYE